MNRACDLTFSIRKLCFYEPSVQLRVSAQFNPEGTYMAIHASKEFKGIGFDYDASAQPFFKAIVKENLRKLAALKTGKGLLKLIKNASPAYRLKAAPKSVNVVIQPPLDRDFLTPGMKRGGAVHDQGKVDAWRNSEAGDIGVKLIPTLSSKTQVGSHCTKSQGAPKYAPPEGTGGGSTCYLMYSNTEILSDSGLWAIPHITMGHELIHCLHALYGKSKFDDRQEEYYTVGIKGYDNEAYTENKLRAEAGFPLRKKYFKDD